MRSCHFNVVEEYFVSKVGKIALQFLFILVGASVLGILLLTAVYLLPLDQDKLETAAAVLYEQNTSADYPLLKAWEQNYFSYRPGVFDGNTATTIFHFSVRSLDGQSPVRLALVEDYPRYWHGYVLIMRPLLAIFEYKDLEIFFSYLLIMLAIGIAAGIGKRKGALYAAAFGTSFLMLMPMIVGICTQYLWIALIAYGGVLVFMKWEDRLEKQDRYLFFFLILGILTVYFDFLTYPIFTWGIVAVWWLVLEKKERSVREALRFVVLSAISWAIGYVGMWIGKWVVGSILLHENLFRDAVWQILFRTGVQDSLSLRERLYTAYKNWKHYSFVINALFLGIWFGFFLIHGFLYGWKWNKKAPALGLIALSSFVWNMGAANHMEVHHYFTYRIYGVAVMAWLAFVLVSMPGREERMHTDLRKKGKYLAAIGVAGFMALLMTLITCEETEVSNKEREGFETLEFHGGTIEMEFTPTFNRITQVCIALLAENQEGAYTVCLKDGEQVLQKQTIPIAYLDGKNYQLHPVDWKVKKGHAYRLSVETPENGGSFTAYVNEDDSFGMAEVGAATLNGEALGKECCVGVSYWARPFSRYLKAFWMMSWMMLFCVAAYLVCMGVEAGRG